MRPLLQSTPHAVLLTLASADALAGLLVGLPVKLLAALAAVARSPAST
jgi:hypothetical protein